MNKEQESQFKENIKEIARLELKNSFNNNLMETLNSAFIFKYVDTLEKQSQKYKKVIDKAIEYITSYESISTIQGLENADINKQFDEKTMTEMINRYLLVHDKLLQILEDKEVE